MGHLADLEKAIMHLRQQGFKIDMFARRGPDIICRVSNVILTDRNIVQLYKEGRLDAEGLKAFNNYDNPRILSLEM